jgi:hypothetical protein
LRLEQDAQSIRVLSKKQEMQTDLSRKRDVLARLQERLADLNDVRIPRVLPDAEMAETDVMSRREILMTLLKGKI